MKKILSMLLALSMLCLGVPAAYADLTVVVLTPAEDTQPQATPIPALPVEDDAEESAFVSDEMVSFSAGKVELSVRKDTDTVDLGAKSLPDANAVASFERFLDQLPNLKTVNMYSCSLTRAQMREMYERYPDVFFGWTITIPCNNPPHPERTPHKFRTDITAFSTLHNNQCTNHTNEELSMLRYCKNLLALDIGHNDVTDLSFLYDLPNLRVLILGRNNNLQDITPLGSLKDLEYLELFSTNVSDISPLANCTNLVDLNICNDRIDDLTPLMGLTSLRRLFLCSCNSRSGNGEVPRSVIAQLRNALPLCKIDNETSAASGAWRTHPRYDTINTMFWGTEYIPFTTLD